MRLDTLEDRAAPDSLADMYSLGTLNNVFGTILPPVQVGELSPTPIASTPSISATVSNSPPVPTAIRNLTSTAAQQSDFTTPDRTLGDMLDEFSVNLADVARLPKLTIPPIDLSISASGSFASIGTGTSTLEGRR